VFWKRRLTFLRGNGELFEVQKNTAALRRLRLRLRLLSDASAKQLRP
jgi:hypothetical protein